MSKAKPRSSEPPTPNLLQKFVKQGQPVRRATKKPRPTYWGEATDWKILMDTRQKQYQVPPNIASTSLRPDICVYSESTRKVCFVELTSPAEENIQIWKLKKREKYINLIEEAKTNGWKAMCRTMEVGARGFVSKTSLNIFSILGFSSKEQTTIRKELTKVAIRCSHYIWICRDNPEWASPARLCN